MTIWSHASVMGNYAIQMMPEVEKQILPGFSVLTKQSKNDPI